jgi:hypothetical protein
MKVKRLSIEEIVKRPSKKVKHKIIGHWGKDRSDPTYPCHKIMWMSRKLKL